MMFELMLLALEPSWPTADDLYDTKSYLKHMLCFAPDSRGRSLEPPPDSNPSPCGLDGFSSFPGLPLGVNVDKLQ